VSRASSTTSARDVAREPRVSRTQRDRIARWTPRVSRTQRISSQARRRASAARNASHPALDAARQPRAMHRIPRWTPRISRTQHIPSHARRRTSAARNASHPTLDAAHQPHTTHRIPRSTPRVSRTQSIASHARRRASAARNTSHPTLDAARSAGGTRGEALVLSDNRTAPFGCALMTARLLCVDDGASVARCRRRAPLRRAFHAPPKEPVSASESTRASPLRATRPFGPATFAGDALDASAGRAAHKPARPPRVGRAQAVRKNIWGERLSAQFAPHFVVECAT
jgi:hypothetical protein